MRISDWSSDVCSSDLQVAAGSGRLGRLGGVRFGRGGHGWLLFGSGDDSMLPAPVNWTDGCFLAGTLLRHGPALWTRPAREAGRVARGRHRPGRTRYLGGGGAGARLRWVARSGSRRHARETGGSEIWVY